MIPCCKGSPRRQGKTLDLTYTILRTLRSLGTGGGIRVDEETLRARLEVCGSCVEKVGLRCRECGCYLSLKAPLKEAVCPLAKWPPARS